MDKLGIAHGALGPLRQAGETAALLLRLPGHLVVRRRPRRQDRNAAMITRRTALALAGSAAAASVLPCSAGAQETEADRISAFGDSTYAVDFKHLAYVNPDAPKGGAFSQIGPQRQYNQSFLTFNSLNSFVLKGDAAQGMELTFATLLARALDEPDAMYGVAARAVRVSADKRTYRFLMRPEATLHDGTKLTAN